MKEKTHLIFVKIPEQLSVLERAKKYEDPLENLLGNESIGFISGGGTMLSAPDETGHREIEFCGVDIEVYELQKEIDFLQEALKNLNAPEGTILELEENEQQKSIEI